VDEVRDQRSSLSPEQLIDLERCYDDWIERGLQANPLTEDHRNQPKKPGRTAKSPPRNLLERLKEYKRAVLAILRCRLTIIRRREIFG
jgi:hypothetical protein